MLVRADPRFVLSADYDGPEAAIERVRLRDGDLADAVADVRAFLAETRTQVASWWLSERSTPENVEAQLLAAGAVRADADYLNEGLLATEPPPAGPPEIVARELASLDEYLEAQTVHDAAFGTAPAGRRTRAQLEAAFRARTEAVYAAWLDGRMIGTGRAVFTRVGAYLLGGSTLPDARGRGAYRALVRARWDDAAARGTPALAVGAGAMSAPILRSLGFVQVCELRRLELPSAAPRTLGA
jgi:hypothetical protein